MRVALAAFVANVVLVDCKEPTYVRVAVITDVPCDRTRGTEVTVGLRGTIENLAEPSGSTLRCINGDVGAIVAVPRDSRAENSQMAVKVVMAIDNGDGRKCTAANGYAGCIVARRVVSFIANQGLALTVRMHAQCIDVPCTEVSTCRPAPTSPYCIDALQDPDTCIDDECAAAEGGPDATSTRDASSDSAATNPDAAILGHCPTVSPCVVKVSAQSAHTCALLSTGQVTCWGSNEKGQLGRDGAVVCAGGSSSVPAIVALPSRAIDIATGLAHTCAVLDDGTLRCWGRSDSGALGFWTPTFDVGRTPGCRSTYGCCAGDMAAVPATPLPAGRHAVAVTAGTGHTCVLLDDASVRCFGENDRGQLGIGSAQATWSTTSGEQGSALPRVDIGLVGGAAARVSKLVANTKQTCALLQDGQLKCWGDNTTAALGQPDGPAQIGKSPGDVAALTPVNLGTGASAHVVTMGVATAVLADGRIKAWGAGTFGRLGNNSTVSLGQTPTTMGDVLPSVNFGPGSGTVVGMGTYEDLASNGSGSTCAIFASGKLKCWGGNLFGNLGYGHVQNIGDDVAETTTLLDVDLGAGRTATSVNVAYGHTCAILDNGALKCWGHNDLGELGLSDTRDRGDDAGEMGDALPYVPIVAPR